MTKLILIGSFFLGGILFSNAQSITFKKLENSTFDYGLIKNGSDVCELSKLKILVQNL